MSKHIKMSRLDRAKQFAPFDALKGLRFALYLKEIEHERISRNEISEDEASKISFELINLNENIDYEITYYRDGFYKKIIGKIKLKQDDRNIVVGTNKIDLDEITDIKKM